MDYSTGIGKVLYDWQTLEAGIIALVGAGLAVWATRDAATRQIVEMQKQLRLTRLIAAQALESGQLDELNTVTAESEKFHASLSEIRAILRQHFGKGPLSQQILQGCKLNVDKLREIRPQRLDYSVGILLRELVKGAEDFNEFLNSGGTKDADDVLQELGKVLDRQMNLSMGGAHFALSLMRRPAENG